MRYLRVFALFMLFAFALTACIDTGAVAQSKLARDTSPQVSEEDRQALVDGNNAFAFDLYQQVRAQDGNLVYSPYSISLASAMLYGGAQGETAQQIADTLHFTLPADSFHPAFNALSSDLAQRPEQAKNADSDSKMELNIANALWSQQDYPIEQPFLDLLAVNYGAGVRLVDFVNDPAGASEKINNWVSQETKDKIKQIVSPGMFDERTRLALSNAIYFKANWQEAFVEKLTAPADFTLLDGSVISVPTMQTEEGVPLKYGAGDGYQAISLPYKGDQTEMIILLPDQGAFADFELGLDAGKFSSIVGEMQNANFSVYMPKFEFTKDLDLKTTLTDMGMTDAFDDTKSDFSNITTAEQLFLQQALHKAYILVNEEGTEAAAATFFSFGATSAAPPEEVRIDRPFIFAIRDVPTGTILFVGRVLNPLEE